MLVTAQRFEHPTGFLSAAAAQFSDRDRRRESCHDVFRMPAQKALIGASQTIFGKDADDLEKRGSNAVIQVFRRQFFLARLGQTYAHIGGKIESGASWKSLRQHAVLQN